MHDTLIWDTRHETAVRLGDWKLRTAKSDGHAVYEMVDLELGEFLYDLSSDPGEQFDLKDKHPDIFNNLKSIHQQWRTDLFYINDTSSLINKQKILDFQNELNEQFADPEHSPLLAEDLKTFETLEFFPIDLRYRVKAEFKRTPKEKPFEMKTTTDRLPIYVKFGEAYLILDDKNFTLNIYQNVDLVKKEGYEDYLFLPYTDLTSGEESYGGGRYIDLRIPEGDTIIIDFNKSYNPYCAYNYKYSCPVPPVENRMGVEIRAGVKAFN
jgi:uncharacterized protein (DUF1684 family)